MLLFIMLKSLNIEKLKLSCKCSSLYTFSFRKYHKKDSLALFSKLTLREILRELIKSKVDVDTFNFKLENNSHLN